MLPSSRYDTCGVEWTFEISVPLGGFFKLFAADNVHVSPSKFA